MGARLILTTCLACFSIAAIAVAGEADPTIKGSKRVDGPYKTGTLNVNADPSRDLYVRVVSNASQDEEWMLGYEVNGGFGTEDYKVKWFRGKQNITDEVDSSSYAFNLKEDGTKRFRVRVKATVGNPEDICLYPQVHQGGTPLSDVFFAINGDKTTCV